MIMVVAPKGVFERFRTILGAGAVSFRHVTPHEARALDLAAESDRVLALQSAKIVQEWIGGVRNGQALTDGRIVTTSDPAAMVALLREEGLWPADARELVRKLVAADIFERAYYAYPLMTAVAQAERMGVSSIVAVELGVWKGVGLLNMASLARVIGEAHDVRIRVVGFDTGAGMPDFIGWPDHPELWHDGDLVMPDVEALRAELPANAELIIGNVAETIPAFTQSLTSEEPLAFVALDLDFYSSSADALQLFDHADQSVYLPAVPLYVDDSYIGITQHQLSGEALAIHMHNLPNMRALEAKEFDKVKSLILPKSVRPRDAGAGWHHCIYFAHMCQHPARREKSKYKFNGLHHVRY